MVFLMLSIICYTALCAHLIPYLSAFIVLAFRPTWTATMTHSAVGVACLCH